MLSKYNWFDISYLSCIKNGRVKYRDGRNFIFECQNRNGVYIWSNPSGTQSELLSTVELSKRLLAGLYAKNNFIVRAYIEEFIMLDRQYKRHQYVYKTNDKTLKRVACEVTSKNWVNLLYRFKSLVLYYPGFVSHYERIEGNLVNLETGLKTNIASLNLKNANHVFIVDCNGRVYEFDL